MSKNKVDKVEMRVKPTSEKVAEIMRLCYLITKKTKYCAFLNFSGHVNNLDISIRHSKSDYNVSIAKVDNFYLDKEKHSDGASLAVRLDKIIKKLEKFLSTKVDRLDS